MSLRNGADNGNSGGNGGSGGGFGSSSVWAPTSVSGSGWSSEVTTSAAGSSTGADATGLKAGDEPGKDAWPQLDGAAVITTASIVDSVNSTADSSQQQPRSAGGGSAWGGGVGDSASGGWDATSAVSPTSDTAKSVGGAMASSSTAPPPPLSSQAGVWSSAGLGGAASIWGTGPQAGDSAAASVSSPTTPAGSMEAAWMSGAGWKPAAVPGPAGAPADDFGNLQQQLGQQQQLPQPPAASGGPAMPDDPSASGGGQVLDAIVNSNDGWGSRPINQTTPWDLGSSDAAAATASMRPGESLVWNQEPNNGTAIWETYYESRGERPGRWDRGQQQPPPSSMEAFQSGGQPPWTGGWNSAEADEPWSGLGGHQGVPPMMPHPKMHQQPHHQQPPPLSGGQPHSKPEMRATLIRQLVEYGFSREEATQALINNNMSLEGAMNELRAGLGGGGGGGSHPHQQRAAAAVAAAAAAAAAGGYPPSGGGGGGSGRGGAPPPQMRDQIMRQLQAVVHRGMMVGPPPLQQQQQQQQQQQMPPAMQQDAKLMQQQLMVGQNQLNLLTNQQQKLVAAMRQQGQMSPMYAQHASQLQELVVKSNQLKTNLHQITQQLRAMEIGGGGGASGPDGRALAPGMPPMGQQQQQPPPAPPQSQSRFEAWSGGLRGDEQRAPGQQQQSQLHASLSNPNLMGGPHPAFHRSMSEIAPGGGANRGAGAGGIPGVMDGIPEFVPGQPWAGGVAGVGGAGGVGRDVDISFGQGGGGAGGAVGGGLFSVSHESLEQHLGGGSRTRGAGGGGGGGGVWQQPSMGGQRCCLFMRQLSPQLNRDVLNKICTQQGRVHRLQVHPANLWALIQFSSHDEADKAHKNLLSLAQQLTLATVQEAERLIQMDSAPAPGGWSGGGGGGSAGVWPDMDPI
ncbi:hypothetical protein BOX15_Mlig015338g2 [Macrostomum lignano]|uniref:UBA domain-containing protein n=1 Tax=Macrostomum lignano TaxID=282301 RepID=A0A267GJH1_9PLAT|nr:hypothetical protein BOX15_Mlig015338g2 [Macrostomum lignano]